MNKFSKEKVEERFQNWNAQWEKSKTYQTLLAKLLLSNLGGINKILAYGNGSIADIEAYSGMCQDGDPEYWYKRHVYQHGVMLLIHYLVKASGQQATCYAQDPVYTNIDKSVLGEHDIEILEDPEGFDMIDNESVVICFCPDFPMKQIAWHCARPKILIWDEVVGQVEDNV